jgi:hypothetical protein
MEHIKVMTPKYTADQQFDRHFTGARRGVYFSIALITSFGTMFSQPFYKEAILIGTLFLAFFVYWGTIVAGNARQRNNIPRIKKSDSPSLSEVLFAGLFISFSFLISRLFL